ncbi:MAG: hypothetical protein V1902_00500 [Candidatus Falkowbacteria bacterium]
MKTLALVTVGAFIVCCVLNCTRSMQVDEPYGTEKEQALLPANNSDVAQWIDDGSSVIVTWHPAGTLLKDSVSANVYVVDGEKKHWIADEAVFNAHGWKWEQVITATPEEMACYEESWVVDWQPKRKLFQVLGDDSFYMLEKESEESGCMIYPIPTLLALKTWGCEAGQAEVLSGYDAEQKYFHKCEFSNPLFVRAGALVKPLFSVEGFGAGVIFVADGNGVLRPFLNYEVFQAMGYASAPMNTCGDDDEFYASFVKFGTAISLETATMCAVPQGIDPEENEEPFVAPDVSIFQDEPADVVGDDAYGSVEPDATVDPAFADASADKLADKQTQEDVESLSQADEITLAQAVDNVDRADGGVKCEIVCPSGMNAWLWYGANGELTALETLKFALTKEQICERGFPWVDYNCATPNWSGFDPTLAQIQCDHSFVNHNGVIDFNGEGELFFTDFVCYEWKPAVAKSCGNKCIALSAYYLYRADFALVDIEQDSVGNDFSNAQKVEISADEYYHVEIGDIPAGQYHVQYSTMNGELAYFGNDISLSL